MGESEPTEADLRTYFQAIGRRFPWILAVMILCVAVGVAFSAVQKKQYSATAQLLVQPVTGSAFISGNQQTVSATDVLTELKLITNAPVMGQVTKKLGFTPNISVVQAGQTDQISLTATSSTALQAARVANTYATTFAAYERTTALNAINAAEQQLQNQISAVDAQLLPLESETSPSGATVSTISTLVSQKAGLQEQLTQLQVTGAETPGGIEVVSPASPPTSPSSPKLLRNGLIALFTGLLIGLGVAFAAEYRDDKVYTKDEAERLTDGVPVLAIVPRVKSWNRSERPMLITDVDPFSPATEAYRSLRTSVQFAGQGEQLKTILVTSASGAEGKTSTVANLGVALAKGGDRVVIVSGDLRRPRIGMFFDQEETPGFTSVLLGQEGLKNLLKPVAATPGLVLLGTGPIPPNPAELLGSDKVAEIFRQLVADFQIVLIDSPPLLPVSDPLVLSRYADAVLLVVMVGLSTRAEVGRASELLARVNARPTGIVLNKATRRSAAASKYGYGYRYSHTPQTPEMIPNGNGSQPAKSSRRPTVPYP
jgi:capsular exopolysaccharide synthesis family protein